MVQNKKLVKYIKNSIKKFSLDLSDRIVLTEAATGNYVVTPIIAAAANAKIVYAFTKNSEYGSIDEVKKQTYSLAKELSVENKIMVVDRLDTIPFEDIHILTNTGFLRPINSDIISKLSQNCVIPLMYEPWEFRPGEIDLEACYRKGIKVYGTNENDERLKLFDYLGLNVIYILLGEGIFPIDHKIILIGCEKFVYPVFNILSQCGYKVDFITKYENSHFALQDYDAIIILEHIRNILIIGEKNKAFIDKNQISEDTIVIHISGNVDFNNVNFKYIPETIKPFSYMSIRADYLSPKAVIDLHTAGLKVAEGMLKANEMGLKGEDYKRFMEKNYPALSFEDPKLW